MKFIDLDQYIENKWGSIQSLFQKGEEHFRDIESRAVSEISDLEGVVIASGGGVIKREANIFELKKKGLLFFLDRPLENILSDIQTAQRPLLKDGKNKLEEIYNERYHLYISSCDIHLKSVSTLEDTVKQVINNWKKTSPYIAP